MGKFAVISSALLLFAGCTTLYKVQTPTGEKYLPIDEALIYVNSEADYWNLFAQWRKMYPYSDYLADEDVKKLDRKREEIQQREWAAERERLDIEVKQQEAAMELEFERRKKEWIEFIQSCDGSLRNKTTQEVKKLVDRWKYEGLCSGKEEFCSLENFYKVFGKPGKIQLTQLSISGFVADAYILWYVCKGGNVRITVDAHVFDEGGVGILFLDIL